MVRTSPPGPIASRYTIKNNNEKGRTSPYIPLCFLNFLDLRMIIITSCSYMYCRSLWKHPDINGNIRPCLQKNCPWYIHNYNGRCWYSISSYTASQQSLHARSIWLGHQDPLCHRLQDLLLLSSLVPANVSFGHITHLHWALCRHLAPPEGENILQQT